MTLRLLSSIVEEDYRRGPHTNNNQIHGSFSTSNPINHIILLLSTLSFLLCTHYTLIPSSFFPSAAMAETSGKRNSNTQLLEELQELSKTLYQPNASYASTTTTRRTTSLALPRNSVPAIPLPDEPIRGRLEDNSSGSSRPRQRRMSLSPWRSRPKPDTEHPPTTTETVKVSSQTQSNMFHDSTYSGQEEKKGIWNWKPIRALSHIGMQKLSCLFSVEVVAAQGLPASMNGLRLSVFVRKKETKDGAVQTMPSRVSQGAADFEETLFVKSHVYCTPNNGPKQQTKFEPRPFQIYLFAVDAEALNFGTFSVDLSRLIQESVEKNNEGTRVRQWDTTFNLSGKAKGGELVLKLGFQIMEKDGGMGIYSQEGISKIDRSKTLTPSFGRKQGKSSFSIQSPRLQSRSDETWTPSQRRGIADEIQGIDDFNLDEPAPVPSSKKTEEPEPKPEPELEPEPDFEVVDKGVEVEKVELEEEPESEDTTTEERSASSEVVKEMVTDQVHQTRLTELDSIAQQIKALESMISEEESAKAEEESAKAEETESNGLDADEETVTMEFLQMLEEEQEKGYNFNQPEVPSNVSVEGEGEEDDAKVYVPDLGKGLGCIVQTRNGGYLAAMNPLDIEVSRKEAPKLAMQISKPLVLPLASSSTGFELFQRMAAIGVEELSSQFLNLMPMDDLMGKTAEQIAFEGIASAIIHGRNKEGASSSAARTVAAVKHMATALTAGRKERISTGIWNVTENTLTVDEVLAFSMQKIEAMAVEALKIQADMADEAAPFDVSPLHQSNPLNSAVSLEDWVKSSNTNTPTVTISVLVQLRDPLRRYEVVGGPVITLIHATSADNKGDNQERTYKVTSMHVGGLMVRSGGRRTAWDSEKQRLTAMQWLVAYALGKPGKKIKHGNVKGQDLLWSASSRVMADMWLKSMRNPDIKFAQ